VSYPSDTRINVAGEILAEGTTSISYGWNLIGNPLVAKFPLEWIELIDAEGDVMSWSSVVSSNKIMPYVFGYNNEIREHEVVDMLEPFYGYWIYASEDLELSFEPRIYDESLYENDRNSYWELTLHSSVYDPSFTDLSIGDHVKLGLKQNSSDGFEYGVDGYNLEGPLGLGALNTTDIYIDHSLDWQDTVSSKFYSDIRSSNLDSPVLWTVRGQKIGETNKEYVSISWEMENEGISEIDSKDIFFQYLASEYRCICPDEDDDGNPDDCDYEYVGELCDLEDENSCGGNSDICAAFTVQELVNMNDQTSVIIHQSALELGMLISIVDQDLSCEALYGTTTCANNDCGESEVDGCSCEQNGDITCGDGSCASISEVDGCSCEQDGLGVTCANNECGELEDGSCSCAQDGLIDCSEDGDAQECLDLTVDLSHDQIINEEDCCEDVNDNGWCDDIDPDLSNEALPEEFSLSMPYPNPFNPSTTISYDVPSDMNINLAVYDIRGRMVTELANGMREQGRYDVIWNAENQSSGVYFMKLVAGNTMKTQKMMLVK
jgi:hypothetical protein